MGRARWRSERGESLAELLLAVLVLGTVTIAVLAALGASIIASDTHRKEASANVLLVSALESVKGQPYVLCDTAGTGSYSTAGLPLPAGWSGSVTVTAVEGWDGTTWVACPTADSGLERVTVQVTSSDGRGTASAHVVKRGP
jgi:hypothetical protein